MNTAEYDMLYAYITDINNYTTINYDYYYLWCCKIPKGFDIVYYDSKYESFVRKYSYDKQPLYMLYGGLYKGVEFISEKEITDNYCLWNGDDITLNYLHGVRDNIGGIDWFKVKTKVRGTLNIAKIPLSFQGYIPKGYNILRGESINNTFLSGNGDYVACKITRENKLSTRGIRLLRGLCFDTMMSNKTLPKPTGIYEPYDDKSVCSVFRAIPDFRQVLRVPGEYILYLNCVSPYAFSGNKRKVRVNMLRVLDNNIYELKVAPDTILHVTETKGYNIATKEKVFRGLDICAVEPITAKAISNNSKGCFDEYIKRLVKLQNNVNNETIVAHTLYDFIDAVIVDALNREFDIAQETYISASQRNSAKNRGLCEIYIKADTIDIQFMFNHEISCRLTSVDYVNPNWGMDTRDNRYYCDKNKGCWRERLRVYDDICKYVTRWMYKFGASVKCVVRLKEQKNHIELGVESVWSISIPKDAKKLLIRELCNTKPVFTDVQEAVKSGGTDRVPCKV